MPAIPHSCTGATAAVVARGAGTQIPLGILRDHVWQNETFDAAPGDLFVLYTDASSKRAIRSTVRSATSGSPISSRTGPMIRMRCSRCCAIAVIEHQNNRAGVDDQTVIVLRLACT